MDNSCKFQKLPRCMKSIIASLYAFVCTSQLASGQSCSGSHIYESLDYFDLTLIVKNRTSIEYFLDNAFWVNDSFSLQSGEEVVDFDRICARTGYPRCSIFRRGSFDREAYGESRFKLTKTEFSSSRLGLPGQESFIILTPARSVWLTFYGLDNPTILRYAETGFGTDDAMIFRKTCE